MRQRDANLARSGDTAGLQASLQLVRGGLSLTVALAAASGALLTARPEQAPVAFASVLLLAAGCSALNQIQERDLDRLCDRTRHRPLACGALPPPLALATAIVLLAAGAGTLYVFAADRRCLLPAALAVVLYNGVYTPLKRRSPLALVPGAVAGALPPLIGAATAGTVPPSSVVLSGAILLWQMPHAWLVQLRHRDDCECLPLPLFCRGLSNGQLRRLVFTWSAAFAALPPLVVLLVGGKWHSALLACALLLMVLLTAAGLPLLGRDEAPRLYPRLEAALRLGLLLLLGLVVFAARTPA